MLLCSKLLKYHGPSGDQQKDLLHDIIAYYVELGNPWPPYQHSQILSHIGPIPIENLLVDLFRQVYLLRGGYMMVCRNQSWQQVQHALCIPKSPTSNTLFLETIYRVILLSYERERRRLETGETRQRQDIGNPHDWIGWSIKLQLILHDLSGSNGIWLWGTVIAFRATLQEHIILLDIGRWISVHLDDVVVELGTLDHALFNALSHIQVSQVGEMDHNDCSSNGMLFLESNGPSNAPSSKLPLSSMALMSNEVFTGVASPVEDHLFIEYDLSPQLYHFETGRKISELARSWTEPCRKRCMKDLPPVISKYSMLIIRCICGCHVDNGDMICCSQCRVWSHKRCVGWENITNEDTLHTFRCFLCDSLVVPQSKLVQSVIQAVEGVRKQSKWSDIQERIQQGDFWDQQYEDSSSHSSTEKAHSFSEENAHRYSSTIQGWRSTKRLKNNVREIAKGHKRARVQAPPFLRKEDEEKQFYKAFLQFWKMKGKPLQKIPMFRGKPFDFYALHVGVRDRGGEEASQPIIRFNCGDITRCI
ncbi:DNA binding / transcription factor [Galdieria sulphuraria]|uniref:DNA binding / transcription factor n=1 Tax=Galdieria sulphuraria TaxID=130081 RepID=M2Y5I8_GALSU|nr:DNA binding / transcription factor [Galdieria sulphuraria]EME31228.1 DNA binding / transcription factor [Galdieria sulphuraria]|eukprot:XP_005707748.1 DNA binding / transcription factor [Galdieria sulphuraria]